MDLDSGEWYRCEDTEIIKLEYGYEAPFKKSDGKRSRSAYLLFYIM